MKTRLFHWMVGDARYTGRWESIYDWIVDHITYKRLMGILCIRGHTPIDDQCDRPEHRFCAYCRKSMPHAKVVM